MLELLSPAGSPAALRAAVENGADAVYFGGKDFNARDSAANFTDGELAAAIDDCRLRGVRTYITVNTLYKDAELSGVLDFCANLYARGADAFITQDLGLATLLKKNFPHIKLHASTQMTAHSAGDAEFLQDAGFDRIVAARECSLAELKEMASVGVEVEVFAHGALCYCYSGRCLMSSVIGGRSGNRGKCAQPCRLPYTLIKDGAKIAGGYLLSPKDLSTLDLLPEIAKTGVCSLKIEGRMKSPEYVAMATRAYRAALDNSPPLEGCPKGGVVKT